MASLTKVVVTTSAIMRLYEDGLIGLDDKLIKYIPEADNHSKDKITIKNLLLHNSGLAPDYPFGADNRTFYGTTKEEILDWMYNCPLDYTTGY
jgi:CubicO group peptidase (beta-lactamase class C family)